MTVKDVEKDEEIPKVKDKNKVNDGDKSKNKTKVNNRNKVKDRLKAKDGDKVIDIQKVKDGDKVKIEYTGTLDDGTVFDSSDRHDKPLEFDIGAKQVIPGFEQAIIGMKKGEEKEIKLKPEESYGDVNPQLLKELPRDQLPKEQEPKAGMVIAIGLPDGRQIPARITDVTDTIVKIDLNHPLAGKNLTFKVKLIEIN
ncbi:MAG: peptidylprolyl isomerase [Candidatus Woesearchaeota archaeon]